MPTKESISPDMRKAKRTERLWMAARIFTGICLSAAGFVATIGAVIGVASAAFVADGGHPNGGYAFMLMGMILAAVIGLLPAVLWVFTGSADNRARSYSSLLIAALCFVGCALGHSFGGASWSAAHLDFVVGGAAGITVLATMMSWMIVPREENASQRSYNLELAARKNIPLPPPPAPGSPWEKTYYC